MNLMSEDLISREALLQKVIVVERNYADLKDLGIAVQRLRMIPEEAVMNAPVASGDIVKVIRCKDCVYYHGGYCERIAFVMNARFNGTEEVKNPDDFCSMGEAHGR